MSRRVPLVLGPEWSVSTSHLDTLFSSRAVVAADDGMHTLNVYRVDGSNITRHPEHDGLRFRTREEVDAYCLTHHLLFPYVGVYTTTEQREVAESLAAEYGTTVTYASTVR